MTISYKLNSASESEKKNFSLDANFNYKGNPFASAEADAKVDSKNNSSNQTSKCTLTVETMGLDHSVKADLPTLDDGS